jgi:hypothetical protein
MLGLIEDPCQPRDLTADGAARSNLRTDMLDICRRLKLSMQLVHGVPSPFGPAGFGDRWTPAGQAWSRLDDRALQAVLAKTFQTLAQQVVEIDGVNVVSSPVAGASPRAAAAVLLAGRASITQRNPARTGGSVDRQQLATIASWLAAVGADGPSSSKSVTEVHRLASLLQILEQAVGANSEREVVRAFIEALSVWTDAESWAFLGDLRGECELHVLLPGSEWSSAPARLTIDIIPSGEDAVLLSAAEARRTGFQGDMPIVVSRIRANTASDWLIATRSAPEQRDEARLALYGHVLAQALSTLAAIESSRLTWATLQHLSVTLDDGSLKQAAESAIKALGAAIGGPSAFALERPGSRPILQVGRVTAASGGGSSKTSEALIVPVDVPAPYSAAIEIGRPVDRPLTRRDGALARRSSQLLSGWLNVVIERLSPPEKAQFQSGAFDQVVEHLARKAFDERQDVSMIVVTNAARLSSDGPTPRWFADIKRQLRPGDLTGRLSSGHVGILLPHTPGDAAYVVVERLKRLIESSCGPDASSLVSIDLLSRPADSRSYDSLVVEAETLAAACPSSAAGALEGRL